jgi:hypothetical protein
VKRPAHPASGAERGIHAIDADSTHIHHACDPDAPHPAARTRAVRGVIEGAPARFGRRS